MSLISVPKKMCLKSVVLLVVVVISLAAASENDSGDWLDSKLSWECANNASCLESIKTDFVKGLQERRSFNFGGAFSIEPTGDVSKPINEGRGFVSDIFSGNALRIPIGGMAVTIQRSPEYQEYLEVALVKSFEGEARRRGGFGGGGGGGGAGGIRKSKKYIQTFIPMFLAMNALGWMLLAVKAVASLTVKAFFVSKLALLVAGTIVFKKLMDSATEKLISSHQGGWDHGSDHGLMLPYNMEYALPSHNYHTATDMSGSDLFSVHLPSAHDALSAAQSLGAADGMTVNESQVNQVVSSLNNAQKQQQQQQAIAAGLQAVPKVKRQDDIWTGYLKKPMFYNSAANAAAAANPVYFYSKA